MSRRWVWLAGVVLLVSSCAPARYTRAQARDRWVKTYVTRLHITQAQAGCIVDRFFGETSDDELKPLTKGQELTDAQAQRIGELAVACGVGPDTPPDLSNA